MSEEKQPFPVPKTFDCPYCGEVATAGNFKPDGGFCHFSHKVKRRIKVGYYYYVTIETIHQFEIHWCDEGWQSKRHSTGSSQMCERVVLGNGDCTDWRGFDPTP